MTKKTWHMESAVKHHKCVFQRSFWISQVLIASTFATRCCYLSGRPQERSENLFSHWLSEKFIFLNRANNTDFTWPTSSLYRNTKGLFTHVYVYQNFCQERKQDISPTKLGVRKPPETISDLLVASILQSCL